MQIDRTLEKLEIHLVTAIAVVLISALAFAVSAPFSEYDDGLSGTTTAAAQSAKTSASPETQPALLEPSLRSLDGVTYHG